MKYSCITKSPILINADKYDYINCCDENVNYVVNLNRTMSVVQKEVEYVIEASKVEDVSLLLIEAYIILYNLKEKHTTEKLLEVMEDTLKELEVNCSDVVDAIDNDTELLLNTIRLIPTALDNPGIIYVTSWNKYGTWSIFTHIGECYER